MTTLCFFALAMCIASLWIKKTAWLWGSFLLIAVCIAYKADIITTFALIPIAILLICQYCLHYNIYRPLRFIFFCAITLTSFALLFHFLPGFHVWRPYGEMPGDLCFYFDKPFIGIFVLAMSLPLIASKSEWFRICKLTLPLTILGILLFAAIALKIKMISWNPQMTKLFFPWACANLFFVSIPEEAFFRGFIQRELYLWFGKTPVAALGAVCISSLFFVLVHLMWVGSFAFLAVIFLTSLLYGILYQSTEKIESSILCHFLFNATQFLLFTSNY